MKTSKQSRDAHERAQLAAATQIDTSNIVSGRRKRSVHNYAEENTAGKEGRQYMYAVAAPAAQGRGRAKGRGGAQRKRVGIAVTPPKHPAVTARPPKPAASDSASAAIPEIRTVEGVLRLAFEQEVGLRSINALVEVEIQSTIETTFTDALYRARKEEATEYKPAHRRKSSARYPKPREWSPDAPFKSERWSINEHERNFGPVDRIVFREIAKERIRTLARSGGIVQLSGFQYHLPMDHHSQHGEHYERSYREIMSDSTDPPENKKYLDLPPMINLQGARFPSFFPCDFQRKMQRNAPFFVDLNEKCWTFRAFH